MTGQSTQRPAARSSERAAQPPTQRGPRGHGQGSAAGGHGHSHGGGPASRRGALLPGRLARPQAGWVLLALPVLGALVDEVSGAPLGGFFLVCSVLASAWAALLSTRRGLWWVLPSPPLVVAAVALLDQLLLHGSDFTGNKLGTGLLKWSVDLFPTMFFALLAAFVAPALRRALLRRSAARAAGRGAQVPVPRRSHHD
ncbi:hypothetical protein DN069_18710 [Streptacidiphilus pinicola]|uniref:DUF6542 domain-containing protein n=1 Tax=Streptacidiphilus pinicola TaxID=2219663 RepID=A0A2X0J1J8_9ACTN|nr:DUF6542 domain-containing protein [Streptacidiphilus pinicola]RAG84076.1 hypothetical protein DN069_18710 [Streptacidiphilus pinicola]